MPFISRATGPQKFPKDNTKDTPFYINKNDTLNVPMMYHKEKFIFADCGEVLLLELPYKGKSLSMLVLLPEKNRWPRPIGRDVKCRAGGPMAEEVIPAGSDGLSAAI